MATAKKKITKKEEGIVVTNPNETEETKAEAVQTTEDKAEVIGEPTTEAPETEETKVDEEKAKDKDEVVVEPELVTESTISKEEPNVRIKTTKNYHCCVAGKMYYFDKGQCYNVPKNIKMVLNKAGVLAVL